MGTFIGFKASHTAEDELYKVYVKHLEINKEQFKNDFGEINAFNDVFEIQTNRKCILKIGVLNREFYSRDFLKDVYCVLIDFATITQEDEFWYEIKNVPSIRLMKQVSYIPTAANIYCFESTKLGADWKETPQETLKEFINTNDLFFDRFFEIK